MKKSNLIIFILISVIFTLVVSIVYFLNISSIIDKKSKGRVYEEVEETVFYLNSYTKRFYDDIEEYLNIHDGENKDTIIRNLAASYDYETSGVLFFGYYNREGDEITFGNLEGTSDIKETINEAVTGFRNGFVRDDNGRFLGNENAKKKISIAQMNYIFRTSGLEYSIIFYNFGSFFFVQDFSRFSNMLTTTYKDGEFKYITFKGCFTLEENDVIEELAYKLRDEEIKEAEESGIEYYKYWTQVYYENHNN